MAQAQESFREQIVERNILLSGKIMQFLMENPEVFDALPDKFETGDPAG